MEPPGSQVHVGSGGVSAEGWFSIRADVSCNLGTQEAARHCVCRCVYAKYKRIHVPVIERAEIEGNQRSTLLEGEVCDATFRDI